MAKSSKGPCIPIHVIKKTWGSSHKVTCELDICSAVMDFKRSRIRSCQCAHLKSVDYCKSDSGDIVLHEETLREMVEQKWFSKERKTVFNCSERSWRTWCAFCFICESWRSIVFALCVCFWAKSIMLQPTWKNHGCLQCQKQHMALPLYKAKTLMHTQGCLQMVPFSN